MSLTPRYVQHTILTFFWFLANVPFCLKSRFGFLGKGSQHTFWGLGSWKSLLCSFSWQCENLGKCTIIVLVPVIH